jgi:DNA-binding NtrC family response regulator
VGELPASLQAKLLRVVETREVTRVGGVRSHLVDVRFLSATNRSLAAEVARGAFRPDLMFRLNGASLEVPPLRERPLEIGPLVELFLGRVAAQLNLPQAPTLSSAALEALHAHAWPGNVRELRNVIERAVLIHAGDKIEAQDLALLACPPLEARGSNTRPPPTDLDTAGGPGSALLSSEAERERIMKALRECGGNQSRAAKFLNMPRRTLVRRIALLGLPRPRDVGDADDADDADD